MKTGVCTSAFDIELDSDICKDSYTNAELTISINLGFKQINPAGSAAEGTYHDYGDPTETARKIVAWTAGSWELWKKQFIKSAQDYWNGKFWLVNNFSELEFDHKGARYRSNIWCRFRLRGVDADKDITHHTIEVVRLHKTEKFFGSHSRLYDSRDTESVRKGTDTNAKPIMQRAHVHEVGHLLGLGHVDIGKPHCPPDRDTNAAACYGVVDADKMSVMGQGMQLKLEHALPWRKGIILLTGKGSATALTDWEAKLVRHYPRTAAEVAAKRAITTKPQR